MSNETCPKCGADFKATGKCGVVSIIEGEQQPPRQFTEWMCHTRRYEDGEVEETMLCRLAAATARAERAERERDALFGVVTEGICPPKHAYLHCKDTTRCEECWREALPRLMSEAVSAGEGE